MEMLPGVLASIFIIALCVVGISDGAKTAKRQVEKDRKQIELYELLIRKLEEYDNA